MRITFLGTSSMHPTAERAQTGIYIQHGTEKILIDCGEGIQRQMRLKGLSVPKITRLFITHEHNDHILGFPGIVENLSHAKAKGEHLPEFTVHGPRGIKKKLHAITQAFKLDKKIPLTYKEITKNGKFLDTTEIECHAHSLQHSVPCIGYVIKEKDARIMNAKFIKEHNLPRGPLLGKLQKGRDVMFKGRKIKSTDATLLKPGRKIAIILDTKYCKEAIHLAKDADVLIIESTFTNDMQKKSSLYKHLTADEASKIAKEARAKHLVLTHFSQRYNAEDLKLMKEQAEKNHPNVTLAHDLMDINVP